jgi:hypothetical protein
MILSIQEGTIMKIRTQIGILAATLALTAAPPAEADIAVLLDAVHGCPVTEAVEDALPHCQITTLTAADFTIETMLASGIIVDQSAEIFFEVPAEADALYGRFDFETEEPQLPFISIYGPAGDVVTGHCYGAFHLENPEPGTYRVVYDTWILPMTTFYEIGTGPHFLTAATVADYDLVCALWDDTFLLFVGSLPAYSAREETVLADYVAGGGAYLYLREPFIEIVLKPIVNLYAPRALDCSVDLILPGLLTYAEPECAALPAGGGTRCRWEDLPVGADERAQILYEGKPYQRSAWLGVTGAGTGVRVVNRTEHPLLELSLLRRIGRDDWELVRIDALPGGAVMTAAEGERLSRGDLADHLRARLRQGGGKAGLYPEETEEFLDHYHWDERWLAEADDGSDWCALYRISAAAYDGFIPLAVTPQPETTARALWVWATGLADETEPLTPPVTEPAGAALTPNLTTDLVVHEYGVLRQQGSATTRDGGRDPGFLGWEFYDEAFIVDPVLNCGSPECVLYNQPGGHPAAAEILTPGDNVRGLGSGAIFAPWGEQLLVGNEYCQTADDHFPPGSHPPVATIREHGAGRLAAFHDRNVLDLVWQNTQFLADLVAWLVRETTAAPDLPSPRVGLVAVQPNPFNPRTTVTFRLARDEEVRLAVYDAAGRCVTELASGDRRAGTHTVTWNGRDDAERSLPAGVYFVRLMTAVGSDTRKVMLVK